MITFRATAITRNKKEKVIFEDVYFNGSDIMITTPNNGFQYLKDPIKLRMYSNGKIFKEIDFTERHVKEDMQSCERIFQDDRELQYKIKG